MNIKEKEINKYDSNISEALNTIKLNNKKYQDDSFGLHTDLYQINMAETYWDDGVDKRRAIFEAYFRKLPFRNGYAVFAGLERVIEYLANFRFSDSDIDYLRNELGYEDDFLDYLKTVRFNGNIKSMAEGEIIYPNEPMIQVDAELVQAQLIETPLLNILNFHPLIATKAARIRCAVDGDELITIDEANQNVLLEFGMRRAHEFDAALYGARAAYIGGFNGTSNVRAGKLFGIPVKGTHAHAMVQFYGDDYTAFKKFAKRHKNCIFLVDTFNTLKSGVPNAIKVAKELGDKINFVGIRLDSGDLVHLSIEARKMLDEAGFPNAKIFASNDLDEYEIQRLKTAGAKIDGWGIGTKLITAYDQPALGAVYKLAAMEDELGRLVDTIKLSEDPSKASTPGLKKILRIVDLLNSRIEKDYIAMDDEQFYLSNRFEKEIDDLIIKNIKAIELHKDIIKNGRLIYKQPTIDEMRAYCMSNLKMLRNSYRAIKNPGRYPVMLSDKCMENKMRNIEKAKAR